MKTDREVDRLAEINGRIHRFNQNKPWTKMEEEQLLRLRASGLVWRRIGAILHRTKMAVYTRAKFIERRKLTVQWTEEEREKWNEEYRARKRAKGREYRERIKARRKARELAEQENRPI